MDDNVTNTVTSKPPKEMLAWNIKQQQYSNL